MPRLQITKAGRRYIYLGIAAYLIFLLHALPASFLPRYILPSISAARAVKLQGVRGSIWQGQAMEARYANFSLGKLDWRIRSWGLLLGKLKLHLKTNNDDMHSAAYVDLGLGGSVTAKDVSMQLPAQSLMPLMYGYPMSIGGELRGNLMEVVIERGRVLKAQGRIVWLNAALLAPQNIELGDYLITLEPVDSGSKLLIKDQGRGPVQTEITITVNGTGEYHTQGWLKPRDASQQSIADGLRLLGKPDDAGRYWLNKNGKLRGW